MSTLAFDDRVLGCCGGSRSARFVPLDSHQSEIQGLALSKRNLLRLRSGPHQVDISFDYLHRSDSPRTNSWYRPSSKPSLGLNMTAYAPIIWPFYCPRSALLNSIEPFTVADMSKDHHGRRLPRRTQRPQSERSPSPHPSDRHQSPFVSALPQGSIPALPSNVAMPTPGDSGWTSNTYTDSYTPSSADQWSPPYTAGPGVGSHLAPVALYPGDLGAGEALSVFDNSHLYLQAAHQGYLTTPFPEELSMPLMQHDTSLIFPSSFSGLDVQALMTPYPTGVILPSTHEPPSTELPQPQLPPRPVAQATVAQPSKAQSRGKKRVRSPSLDVSTSGADPAHKRVKRQVVEKPRAKSHRQRQQLSNRSDSPEVNRSESSSQRRQQQASQSRTDVQRTSPKPARVKDDSRPAGACWRCRRYKKPVS